MDSRIREIEQWLDEAKSDLKDNGQEAYLRKLYLLDAEIRAVIRENDPLPEIKRASTGRKPARVMNLPLAVAGLAAFAILGSALVLNQGKLRIPGMQRITPFANEFADASGTSGGVELNMASLNRFPQGEELVSLDELRPDGEDVDYVIRDNSQLFASLSDEEFSAGEHDPHPAADPLEPSDKSSMLLASNPAAHQLQGSPGQLINADYRMAANHDQRMLGQGAYSVDVVLPADSGPTLTPLPQGPIDGSRFNYYPASGDSSGVDQATNPAWSASGASGRSSEVQLASRTPGSMAPGNKAEKMGKLDKAELLKIAEEGLRTEESKDS